jgi:hypothetical protein
MELMNLRCSRYTSLLNATLKLVETTKTRLVAKIKETGEAQATLCESLSALATFEKEQHINEAAAKMLRAYATYVA